MVSEGLNWQTWQTRQTFGHRRHTPAHIYAICPESLPGLPELVVKPLNDLRFSSRQTPKVCQKFAGFAFGFRIDAPSG